MVTIAEMNRWNELQLLIADRARRAALAAALRKVGATTTAVQSDMLQGAPK